MKTKITGYVLSDQNGVVCIVTKNSKNRKTGRMLQTWILNADVDPVTAARTGEESRVCGDCPLRDGRCYVQRGQATASVWRKQQRGGYPAIDWSALEPHAIRIGSFGDPAFVPESTWRNVVQHCAGFIGYTHQWRRPEAHYLREYLMASVDSPAEQREAEKAGWRTFRVRTPDQPLLAGEIVCPASDEAGHRTTCDKCLFCCGRSKRGKSVAIYAHGRRATKFQQ